MTHAQSGGLSRAAWSVARRVCPSVGRRFARSRSAPAASGREAPERGRAEPGEALGKEPPRPEPEESGGGAGGGAAGRSRKSRRRHDGAQRLTGRGAAAAATAPPAAAGPVTGRPAQPGPAARTMSCVHYKFSSKLNYDTLTFDGLHISLCDLKRQIMGREKLKAADCDLQITNAQTKEGGWLRPGPEERAGGPREQGRCAPSGGGGLEHTHPGPPLQDAAYLSALRPGSISRCPTAPGWPVVPHHSLAPLSFVCWGAFREGQTSQNQYVLVALVFCNALHFGISFVTLVTTQFLVGHKAI